MGSGILIPLLADSGLEYAGNGSLHSAGVDLAEIADAIGTPTYVYNAEVIRQQYRLLDQAFGSLPHAIRYAVKANSNLAVLKILGEMGAGADIVSGGELLRVLAAGIDPDKIIFSGVGKTDAELQAAITAGVGHINVESLAELRRLSILVDLQGIRIKVGIRINPDVTTETHPYISTGQGGLKFGITIDQFDEVCSVLDQTSAIQLDAVAMHLGSQLLSPSPWIEGLGTLNEVLNKARSRGHEPAVLDIGGGIGIRYHDEPGMSPEIWIDPIKELLTESGCTIQVEPGRFLVGAAGVLVSEVVHRKRSGGREIAIVDAGMNDLLRPALYKAWHEIVPIDVPTEEPINTDIVGPVCETGDFLALDRPLQPVPAGGRIAVLGAGAYAFGMASNYNSRARPAEVLVDGGRWGVVRPRERLADLFKDEKLDPFTDESK